MRIVGPSAGGAAMTARLTLVLGGARSGKSRYAEGLIQALPPPWAYIATAQAFDDEMRERIATHRARRSSEWTTIEAPIDVPAAIRGAPRDAPALVDCLTLWLTNLMLGEHDAGEATGALLAACREAGGPLVLVSNEVGLGVVPDTPLGRRFRDLAGRLHQDLAAEAQSVILMVAGLPMIVK
jgi:adenosylcobinamide kinase/adenosylcobinamide-phosphate guanylyltransferase